MTGSTTKAFTAAAAAVLVHDEKNYPHVKWTSPVTDFIREDFVLENEHATNHVTIEDTLVHRAGLPRHDLVHGQPNDKVEDMVRKLRYLPLTAEPARKYQYCPIMYGVAAHVLQTITGRSLAEQLERSFWQPLGMLSTTLTFPDDTSKLAKGYWWYEPEARYVAEPYDDLTSISGSGDIFSTVNDYALWMKAFMEAVGDETDEENKSSPLTSNLVRDMFTPRIIQDDGQFKSEPILYGLGWDTATVFGERVVAHGGGETGFGTQVYMLPGKQYGVVTMANAQESGFYAGAVLASHLMLAKLNIPPDAVSDDFNFLGRNKGVRRRRKTTLSDSSKKVLPLPLPLADFTGTYCHPAYGTTNISSSNTSQSNTEFLEALFYPRTWPVKVRLSHISSTTFRLRFLRPHGLGNPETGEGIVWDGDQDDDADDDNFRAVFEFGQDGKTVERVGMELEASQVDMAEELGSKEWRKALIWFDKM